MTRDIDDAAKFARCTMNMTPMIDVVFQLIVVFLCSMKFRTLDQKLEAALPRDRGTWNDYSKPPEFHPVLTVRLQRAGPGMPTRVVLQGTGLGTTGEGDALWERLRASAGGFLGRCPDLEGEIDAEPSVDHGEVVRALDGFVAAGLTRVRFRGTMLRR